MLFYDRAKFTTRKKTKEGFLDAKALVGRPGIQEYVKGVDFLKDDLPVRLQNRPDGTILNLLRPADEVFKPESLKSFTSKPVTNNHPAGTLVDSSNVKKFQVGFTKSVSKAKSGDALEANLLVQDAHAINDINAGKNQISLGYQAEIDWTSGVDDSFGEYDGIQKNIIGNHIAIVDRARAGEQFRILDKKTEKDSKMKTRIFDGVSVEIDDDAANIFDALVKDNKALKKNVQALADSKKEIDKLKGELDVAKAAQITDEDIAKKVKIAVDARVALIDAASKVLDTKELSSKSDSEIKKEVIKKLSDSKISTDDKSDEYIQAVFDTLIASVKVNSNTLVEGLSGEASSVSLVDAARQKMIDSRNGKVE